MQGRPLRTGPPCRRFVLVKSYEGPTDVREVLVKRGNMPARSYAPLANDVGGVPFPRAPNSSPSAAWPQQLGPTDEHYGAPSPVHQK